MHTPTPDPQTDPNPHEPDTDAPPVPPDMDPVVPVEEPPKPGRGSDGPAPMIVRARGPGFPLG